MRALFALILMITAVFPVASRAQSAKTSDVAAEVQSLIDQAMATMAPGTIDSATAAFRFIEPANDLVSASKDLPVKLVFLPNLVAARAYRLQFDWPNMEGFAAAVYRAMDAPEYATDPMRTEAAARLGHAMIRQGRGADAAAILAPVIAATQSAPASPELDLARFWYGDAMIASAGPGWTAAAARAFNLRMTPMIRPSERAIFLDDYLYLLIETDQDAGLIRRVADASSEASRDPDVSRIDRAVYLNRVAIVLDNNGEIEAGIALAQAELAQLGSGYAGNFARTGLGIQLIRMWFETGEIDRGIAFAKILLAENHATGEDNWGDVNRLQVLLGAAYTHLGRIAEAQEAYRRGYSAVRQYERASSVPAQNLAVVIDRSDPGFAGFEYAGELSDASDIRPDGPPEAVMLRFLAGNYALNERVFSPDRPWPEDANKAEVLHNIALHDALSGDPGAAAAIRAAIFEETKVRAEKGPTFDPAVAAAEDEMALITALSAFWVQGPANQTDLSRITVTLSADKARLARMLIVYALHLQGDVAAATRAMVDMRASFEQDPVIRTPWDITAAMVAVEFGYILLDRSLADTLADLVDAALQDQPDLGLAHDYIALGRLANVATDMDTDQGLLDLGAIVQRISGQVPEGHILRVSSRLSLSNALWSRGRMQQARDILAAATDALRANPGYERDVLAALLSAQAMISSQMGNRDLALGLARAALNTLTPNARGDYRVQIVTTLTFELAATGRAREASDLAETQLADPAFAARLRPEFQIMALRTRAHLADGVDEPERAGVLLAQAEAIGAANPGIDPAERIALLWDRGIHEEANGRLEPAFRSLGAANDAYFAERARVATASVSGQAASLTQDLERVLIEMDVGWSLSQTLP